MVDRVRLHLFRLTILALGTYGLFYFSYKYLVPTGGAVDFDMYLPVYRLPLHFGVAQAPFVLRQVSAVLVFLVWKAHLFFGGAVAFVPGSGFGDPETARRIFFAALLVNWVALVVAAWVAGMIAETLLGRRSTVGALLAGMLCVLSFHTQAAVITGLAEGPGWVLLGAAFLAYLRRAAVPLAVVLTIAILERETVILAMATIALLDLLFPGQGEKGTDAGRAKFSLRVAGIAVVTFAIYLALRMWVPGYENQFQPREILLTVSHLRLGAVLLFQGVLSQNIFLMLCLLAVMAYRRTGESMRWPVVFGATLAVLDVVGLAAGIGNNVGRVGAVLTPVFAAFSATYLLKLENDGMLQTTSEKGRS